MKSSSSRSVKQVVKKPESTSKQSKTNWAKLHANEPGHGVADHPQADVRHIMRGVVRRGSKIQPPKAAISLRVEQDVLEWFKAQGPGYQTRMNAVLRAYRDASV